MSNERDRRPFTWEASYPEGICWDPPLGIATLPDLLKRSIQAFPDRPALDYGGTTISNRILGDAVGRAAAAFHAKGLSGGKTLALLLPNVPAFPIVLFDGQKAGAKIANPSVLASDRELGWKFKDIGARTLITTGLGAMLMMALKLIDAGYVERLIVIEEAVTGMLALAVVLEHRDVLSFEDLERNVDVTTVLLTPSPDSFALLQSTGGTTGQPKAAMLAHANLTISISMYETWFRPRLYLQSGENRVMCVLPFSHIDVLNVILMRYLGTGDFAPLGPRFDPSAILDDIELKGVTMFPAVPKTWETQVSQPDIEKCDLSVIHYCGCGGPSLPMALARRFKKHTGNRLMAAWGVTEPSPAGTAPPIDGPNKLGSIGVPLLHVELQIIALDNPRHVLPPEKIAELRVKRPNVTIGYWNRPEGTITAFVDGYVLPGDVGLMDDDGFFFIVEVEKDAVIVDGINVCPQPVEQAIYEHPDVEDAIVIGITDQCLGERAKAFIQTRAGPLLTLEQFLASLQDKPGPFELPVAQELRDARALHIEQSSHEQMAMTCP